MSNKHIPHDLKQVQYPERAWLHRSEIRLGEDGYRLIKLLIGGSPCTHWSIAQKKNRETEPKGLGWELFKNYLKAKKKFNPDFFLYENNKSAADSILNLLLFCIIDNNVYDIFN